MLSKVLLIGLHLLVACLFSGIANPLSQDSDTPESDLDDVDRIVGGTLAEPHSRPWQVFVKVMEKYVCGGTLIHEQWVLSAAHCFHERGVDAWVMVGSNRWCTDIYGFRMVDFGPGWQRRNVIATFTFGYEHSTSKNDIILLKLDRPVDVNNNAHPALLPSEPLSAGIMTIISGWGAEREGGDSVCKLKTAFVPVVEQRRCQKMYPNVYEGNFCAGYLRGGIDTCAGDSGGPLVRLSSEGAIVYGVTSYGFGCANEDKPGVYTNVSYFIPRIRYVLANY